jgi:O-glycosyl hydrolase
VRRRGLRLLAASPMNEPDCGDGSKIAPQDYPAVLKLVAARLRPYGVGIYGPDTCSAENGLAYLEALLADPTALAELDILGVHQYSEGIELARFVRRAREAGLRQPIYVSEFTSFRYGNLDAGDEAGDEIGFTLDALAILRSHLLAGADAALYWDGVDALQEHHGAVTRWGLLRGSAEGFEPRTRYAAFRQLLPYLGPGARVLETELTGDSALLPLAVQPPPDLGHGPW